MTLEQRLNKAFKEIRKQGITVRRNVMGCCQSCANLNLADEAPVLWSFGGQGNRNVITNDDYDYSDWGFNHDNLATTTDLTDAGKRVLQIFADNGIVVEWCEDDTSYRPGRKLTLNLEKSVTA